MGVLEELVYKIFAFLASILLIIQGTPSTITSTTTTTTLPPRDEISSIIKESVEGRTYVWAGMNDAAISAGTDRYNCQDFTRDAMLALREEGYNAYAVYGLASSQTLGGWSIEGDSRMFGHDWVRVEIGDSFVDYEATNSQTLASGTLIRACRTNLLSMNGTDCTMVDEDYEPLRRAIVRGVW